MAEILYNQGGVTIDANGVRTYADGSTDTVDQSMIRRLINPQIGTGVFSGMNMNGGLTPPVQNYSNANDPFSVGYGTPNPSAGTGQWTANTNPTAAPSPNPFVIGGGNTSQNSWAANTNPTAAPQASNPFVAGGGNVGQWTGNASPYPSAGSNPPPIGGAQPMGKIPGTYNAQGGQNPFVAGGGLFNGSAPQAMQSNMMGGLEVNPYLSQMGSNLVDEVTSNFQRNVLPSMRSQMMAAGGIGGSREGVLQANALRDMNSTIGNALGNLYGQGYVQAGNQRLGEGNLGLGYANLDRNINNDNLNWQLQGANFGLGIQDRLNASNAIGLGAGQAIQDTPLNYYNMFADRANAIGQGYGTQTSSGGGSSPVMGALGGAQLGRQIGSWWNTGSQPNRGTSQWSGTDPGTWFNTGSLAD